MEEVKRIPYGVSNFVEVVEQYEIADKLLGVWLQKNY